MALKGTLKDFGIAEILQLIGQQAKSGVLHLRSRDDEIHVALSDGSVVRAEAVRKARERLGSLLVRAEIITQAELDHALDQQKKTLRRLGDLLVELGFVSARDLREMTELQTTETIYRLFAWKSGTYEFEAGAVEWDPAQVTPLRAESVLMEGFRRVDEWPMIRKRIDSPSMTFEVKKALGPAARPAPAKDDVDSAFDALGEGGGTEERAGEFASLGPRERRIFQLASEPGRTVEKIVDLSRLGEFEAVKALASLVNLGYLDAIPGASRGGAVGALAADWRSRVRAGLASAVATVAIAAALAGIGWWVDQRGLAWGDRPGASVRDDAAQRFLARYQMERLRGALEVYRLERGEYPPALDGLVETGLAGARDLQYPWAERYYYRRTPAGHFVLLPPFE